MDELTDADIEEVIAAKDDPGHPDATTAAHIRDLLTEINWDILDWWDDHQDAIDDGAHEIVHEDLNVIVMADHSGQFWNEQFAAMDIDDPVVRTIITTLHHDLARTNCDYSWSVSGPVVVEKTDEFRGGESQVLREIARRTKETGSVARAVDQYATEVRGWSKGNWATLTGRNASTVTRTTRPKEDQP